MRPWSLAVATASALLLCVSQWSVVNAGFYVCPSPCQAKLLPRDMESLEDCLCQGDLPPTSQQLNENGNFRCPEGAAAKRLHPHSFSDCSCLAGFTRDDSRQLCSPEIFSCRGRYRTKKGLTTTPQSVADCDCKHPYKKEDATGQCVLRKCPRAGNYMKRTRETRVSSLADCSCLDPYIKNEQSGECAVAKARYVCPPASQPVANNQQPLSFADCHCDWGFVRTPMDTCAREGVLFACPNHSNKRLGLALGEQPRSFADCECDQSGEFRRNEQTHSCDRINKDVDGDGNDEIDDDEGTDYKCPAFAKPLAAIPHSVEQCECLPGYGWKTPEMFCVRLSGYKCPIHAFKSDETNSKQVEESFADCECARGYYRDDATGSCLEWFLANDNGCPKYAFLRHWPLQSKANCQCIYGLNTAPTEPEETQVANEKQPLRQRKTKQQLVKRKPVAQCNPPPEFMNVGFSQCPENAVAMRWPLASSDDCMCMDGFETTPISESAFRKGDGEGFVCVDKLEAITADEEEDDPTAKATTACKAPQVKNPFTGDCRLPLERVQPTVAKRRSTTQDGGQVPVDTRGEVLFKGIEYDYVLTEDDIMVIQGDIAIGELVQWASAATNDVNAPLQPASHHVLHGYYNSERDHRWQDATMCFQVEDSALSFAPMVDEAMDHITAVTNFQFKHCRNNNCHEDKTCAHDFVSVKQTASSCFSYVGRIGGKQTLGVSSQCGLGNLIHVLLHGVGLRHTIDRVDRDDHVRIAWECLPEGQRSHFVVEDINTTQAALAVETPYDFYSIMHHPADAFVKPDKGQRQKTSSPQWCQSIFPVIATPEERVAVMGRMGQRELLAVTDIHAVWKLYPSLQDQEKPATYESDTQKTADQPEVYESRLHTQEDVLENDAIESFARRGASAGGKSWGKKLGSFVGAMATLLAFGAFMAFAVTEFRRRALLRGGGAYYSESLLTDKALYD